MKRIKERLAALEQGSTNNQQRITCIELVDAESGEVGGVIRVGGPPDPEGVLQALKFKHETWPARTLRAREKSSDQEG